MGTEMKKQAKIKLDQLLGCPFCGHPPMVFSDSISCYNDDCDAIAEVSTLVDVRSAIRQWNTRTRSD